MKKNKPNLVKIFRNKTYKEIASTLYKDVLRTLLKIHFLIITFAIM